MKSTSVSIGDAAARFGVATHVLRHWEDVGLLAPARDAAGRRRYVRDDFVRIAAIRASQSAGLSLEQIGTMLDTTSYGRHELLEQHLADLERRRAELEASRAVTRHALECSAHDLTTCPRFRSALARLWEGGPTADADEEEGLGPEWSFGAPALRAARTSPG